jgi:hypothetical protein
MRWRYGINVRHSRLCKECLVSGLLLRLKAFCIAYFDERREFLSMLLHRCSEFIRISAKALVLELGALSGGNKIGPVNRSLPHRTAARAWHSAAFSGLQEKKCMQHGRVAVDSYLNSLVARSPDPQVVLTLLL